MPSEIINIYQDNLRDLSNYNSKQIEDIGKLGSIIGNKNVTISYKKECRIMHYVGFVSINNTNIQILPKIYYGDQSISSDEEKSASLKFLLRLLNWTGYIKGIKELDSQLVDTFDGNLLEIFIHIFIKRFLNIFSKEVIRQYQPKEENQQFIKGKILFTETIRRNPFLRHQHYVRYEEFTMDNPLNRIFKAVISNLLVQTNHSDNKKLLKQGLTYLEDVTRIQLTPSSFDKIQFNRLNQRYEVIFNLAKLFYFNLQPSIGAGNERTFTFLVRIHDLYEIFLHQLLESIFPPDYKVLHEPKKYLAKSNGKNKLLLKPDIVIQKDGKTLYILDAKYKPVIYIDNRGYKAKAKTSDIYQLIAYSLQYSCKSLYLVYPKYKGIPIADKILDKYEIATPYGLVTLHLVQFDITLENLDDIKGELKNIMMRSYKTIK